MGMCTSVFGIYGIRVPESMLPRLERAVADAIQRLGESEQEFHGVEFGDLLDFDRRAYAAEAIPDEERLAMLRELRMPDDAGFFWTGDDDDRPAECVVEAGCWVVGYNIYELAHRSRDRFPDAELPEMLTWAEVH